MSQTHEGVRTAPAPHLPTATAGGYAAALHRTVPAKVAHALHGRLSEAGLDWGAFLLAAFGDVLAAWSRQSPFSVTYRVIDQHPPHRSGLPAAMTVTSVVPDTDPARTFADRALCTAARAAAGGVRCPIDQPAGPGDVVITVRSAHAPCPAHSGLLGCTATITTGEVRLDWASPPVFPPGLVDDLADAFDELLLRHATEPAAWHTPYHEILPARNQHTRARVNATAGPRPDALLHEMFLAQAHRTPDAPAVITDDLVVTYGELRTAASVIAERLRGLGARPNQLVAVVLDKGWEQVAAVLGILTAGAAYVPIAPDLPHRRLHHLLDHAEAAIALTSPALRDSLPWPAAVTALPVTSDLLAGDAGPDPVSPQGMCDLAYVIYTSGSTGEPKGVMISHEAAGNTIVDINRRHRIGPTDRVLALASLSFDLSVYDIFGPLAVGGAVVMPAPGTSRAPWYWLDALVAHDVTVWDSVPALMEMLTVYADARGERLPGSLRLVLLSGDWIPVNLPARIRALAAPHLDIIGMGGATEASIWSNAFRIRAVDPAWPSIPYGTPLTNQFFEVLDPDLRRRPDWVPGALYIGGLGLATGYWRDPDRTAASFIRHPRTGQRLYRTGDLGRYLPDGNLEFLGRDDFQVKIQGFRVELGEIEAALLAHLHVTAAAVVAVGPAAGERRLIAYVVPTPGGCGADSLAAHLRQHLTQRLPTYMVPGDIVLLDALPLTANGKVDRNTLPRITASNTQQAT
jgi:pyochelin synthetase